MTDPARYGSAIAALLNPPRLADLGPGKPNRAVGEVLARFDPLADLGKPVREPEMARACLAGLWLYHDFLDESHAVSQDLPSAEGSYWHAVMHRREPDASNAGYWFRRVGRHPIFEPLARSARGLGLKLPGPWDPFAFIEQCEQHRGDGSGEEQLLRRVQMIEWELLFDWCYHRAVGEPEMTDQS
jgi:hypothetical protein